MFTPERGHRPRHRAERGGADGTSEHDDGVRRRLADDRVVAALDGDLQADPVNGLGDVAVQLPTVGHLGITADQHAQRQPAADHHLFDVEQFHVVARQHLERGRGHPGWSTPVTVINTDTL